MTNHYGYNRKTKKEDEAIMRAVKYHHDMIASKGYLVVMTSLVGSQNYDLDDKISDIDTYSLIFPPLTDLANAREPKAGLVIVEDGHCDFKDIRCAIGLLRKASPNSVEYFASKYKYYNPIFAPILHDYLDDNAKLWNMIHCNYTHMLDAISGMAYQMSKRNMTPGRRLCHAIRMNDMWYHYMNSTNAQAVLELRNGGNRDLAMIVKRDISNLHDADYNDECLHISNQLDKIKKEFVLTEEQKRIQQTGMALIDSFQWKLFKKYLEETNGV